MENDFSHSAGYQYSDATNAPWRSGTTSLTVVLDVDGAKSLADHICAVVSGARVDRGSENVLVPRDKAAILASMLVWWLSGKHDRKIRAGASRIVSGTDALSLATMLADSASVILEDFGDQEAEIVRF